MKSSSKIIKGIGEVLLNQIVERIKEKIAPHYNEAWEEEYEYNDNSNSGCSESDSSYDDDSDKDKNIEANVNQNNAQTIVISNNWEKSNKTNETIYQKDAYCDYKNDAISNDVNHSNYYDDLY